MPKVACFFLNCSRPILGEAQASGEAGVALAEAHKYADPLPLDRDPVGQGGECSVRVRLVA